VRRGPQRIQHGFRENGNGTVFQELRFGSPSVLPERRPVLHTQGPENVESVSVYNSLGVACRDEDQYKFDYCLQIVRVGFGSDILEVRTRSLVALQDVPGHLYSILTRG